MTAATRLALLSLAFLTLGAGPAWACGFLVAENGAIRLDTFAAAAVLDGDGAAQYVTSFAFNGSPETFGAIIPLPDVPTHVERAPDWFLQRLGIETAPPLQTALADVRGVSEAADEEAAIIETYEVDALDITILEGGGEAVLAWADGNGFDLGLGDGDVEDRSDAVEMLDFYADRSPVFAALTFDNTRAAELGLRSGDGTPVRFAFADQEQAWIPVRVLGFDKPEAEVVVADLYLLTDGDPTILGGQVPGTEVVFQDAYGPDDLLVRDLTGDQRADWVPSAFTLTRINVRSEQRLLDFDIAARVGEVPPAESAYGVTLAVDAAPAPLPAPGIEGPAEPEDTGSTAGPVALALVAVVAAAGMLAAGVRVRSR